MPSFLLSGPSVEPLSLAEAKDFLRVEHDADDDVIEALVVSARMHVEAQTRRALIAQTWRLVRDEWPDGGRIAVRPLPLAELVAARVYRADGTSQTLSLSDFVIDVAAGAVAFAPGASPPAPGRAFAGIELDVSVGYGDDADAVPADLRQAVRLLLAHWYENRGLVGASGAGLPSTVAALLAPHRVRSL